MQINELKRIVLEYEKAHPIIGKPIFPGKGAIGNDVKTTLMIKRNCFHPLIVKNGDFYFCPICRCYCNEISDEADEFKEFFKDSLIVVNVEPFFTYQPNYEKQGYREPLYNAIHQAIVRETIKVIINTSVNSLYELAEEIKIKVSNYLKDEFADEVTQYNYINGNADSIKKYLKITR